LNLAEKRIRMWLPRLLRFSVELPFASDLRVSAWVSSLFRSSINIVGEIAPVAAEAVWQYVRRRGSVTKRRSLGL
jgi:hypothetical protein